MDKKRLTFILMFALVFMWGLDYSVAKNALEVFRPLNLMFFKYFGGLIVITLIKAVAERKFTIRKKDIIFFVMCSLTGQVLYYFCEYTAMEYIPVALITIILSFVPIISILIERVFFKTKLSVSIIAGLVVCVIGVGSAGTGYLIYVRGVKYLGPTISSLFSNFLPVTPTFFGWLILGQSLGVMQIAGGLIVIVSACYVIIEKSRLQKQELKLRLENEIK